MIRYSLVLLGVLLVGGVHGQWGTAQCEPVGSMERYQWLAHNTRPGCYALYLNGRQIGFYDPNEGTYQRWVGANQWATEACPVALPVPPIEKPTKMPVPKPDELSQEVIQDYRTNGVDLKKTQCTHDGGCYRLGGERISKERAMELVGADLPDYSTKLRVVVVGSQPERTAFMDQVKAETSDCIVQDCDPGHWWASTGGYKPGVWIVKPLTATFGQPLWHQGDYSVQAFKEGLQAIRSPQPIDPDKIPGPNSPKPKPKPDDPIKPADGFTPAQWLGIAAAAVLAFFALTHRSQPDA